MEPTTIATMLLGAATTISGAWLAYRTAVAKTRADQDTSFEVRMDKRVEDHIARLEADIARQYVEIERQDGEIRRLSDANHQCERRLLEAERSFQSRINELEVRLGQFENLHHWDGSERRGRVRPPKRGDEPR